MLRAVLFTIAACLAACAQTPQPSPHSDGQIVTHAVQLAQARVDDRAEEEIAK